MFKKAKSQTEAAVKASFVAAQEIAKSACSFTEEGFIKDCMIKVCEVICIDKKQAFSNISLSRNTAADRTGEQSTKPAKGKRKRLHCLFLCCG